MAKRSLEEYDDLSLVTTPTKAAKLHGVLTDISPMKQGKYFEGRIADTQASLRLVGFDPNVQQQLLTKYDKKEAVTIQNCMLQKSKYSDEIEVLVTKTKKIEKSLREFENVVQSKLTTVQEIAMKELQDMTDNQKVSVTVKVLEVEKETEVKQGLYNQDITIADSTGHGRLTLWQADRGKLDINKSYSIKNIIVKSFNGSKYLTFSRSGSTFMLIDDIDSVEVEPQVDQSITITDAEVAGVVHIYISCITCKSKIDISDDSKITVCSNCSTSQRINKSNQQLSAKLVIAKGGDTYQLFAFLPILKEIIQEDPILDITNMATKLLFSDPFTVTFSRNNIISTINRT